MRCVYGHDKILPIICPFVIQRNAIVKIIRITGIMLYVIAEQLIVIKQLRVSSNRLRHIVIVRL